MRKAIGWKTFVSDSHFDDRVAEKPKGETPKPTDNKAKEPKKAE